MYNTIIEEVVEHKTARLHLEEFLSWEQIERALKLLATNIYKRHKNNGSLYYHFLDSSIYELPDSKEESIAFLVSEAKKYFASVEFTDQGATLLIAAESHTLAADTQFFDGIVSILFACSGMDYLIATEKSVHPGIELTRQEILFWKKGEITREKISEIFDFSIYNHPGTPLRNRILG
jgi:hypothetical protein